MIDQVNAHEGTDRPLRVAYVLKRYPRLSETFILNELLGLAAHGADLWVTSLLPREPEQIEHPAVRELRANVRYVSDIGRFRRAACHLMVARRHPAAYWHAVRTAIGASFATRSRRPWKDFRRAVIVADRVDRQGAHHIHAHFATAATRTAVIAAALTHRPVSFTAHAKDIFVIDERGKDLLRRYIAQAAFVVTISEFNMRYLAGLEPAHGYKLRLVPNGLGPEWFTPLAHPGRGPVPLVLAVGRLVEKKGFADLVTACRILRDRGICFRCRIVGTGPLEGTLRQQVVDDGLSQLVELAGPSDQTNLRREHLAAAACLVVPSIVAASGDQDGLPTVLIEAMASGVPVIATDLSGIPEIVVDDVTGSLVPQRDAGALAAAIQRMLGDPRRAVHLATAARSAADRFDRRLTTAALWRLFTHAAACGDEHASLAQVRFREADA